MRDKAAAQLLDNWSSQTRISGLPEDCRPVDRAAGYAVAWRLAEMTGDTVAGWKIAATSEAGQRHINVDGPLIGRIFAKRLVEPGAAAVLGDNIMKVAEVEFAFRFGRDLPARADEYGLAETLAAVTSLHLSIEVPDSRYQDFTKVGAPSLIADTACASWLCIGPPADEAWRKADLAGHQVKGLRNGQLVAEGAGKAALGDPLKAMAWFVNEARRYCDGVKAGQFVTTGTCIVPMAITPGDVVRADYGNLGSLELVIA